MKILSILLSGLSLCSFLPLSAQDLITSAQLTAKQVEQYRKAEWDIALQTTFQNPYLEEEVALDMELISPSGKKQQLPCFHESGTAGTTSRWKARFSPQEAGKYSYVFRLRKAGQLVHTTKTASFRAKATGDKGILHKKNDWTFQFDNGTLFRGIGENICWESRANDDSKFFKELHEKPKYNYEYMLRALAAHGGNYYRTWICSWNLPLDWKTGINNHRYSNSTSYYHPEAIQKMDRLVFLSDSLGLYMMLTLGPGTHDERNGRYATSTREFFTDPKAKAQYRNRLRYIVARWGYSPAIGAWEFFNEIDNVQFRDAKNPISAASIVQWHDEMSKYLKELDPYGHLVTTSISHRDLEGLNALPAIDFNQKHIYKNNRALPATIVKYAADFKKPYVIGEYGYEYDWSKNFNLFGSEMDSDFKRGLWYGLFSPTPILPLSWWWEFFDDRGTDAYISRVSTIQDDMMRAGKGAFVKVAATASSPEIEVYAVKCGKSTYVYVYNPTAAGSSTNISFPTSSVATTLRKYDCESGKYNSMPASISGGVLQAQNIPLGANSDIVLILDK